MNAAALETAFKSIGARLRLRDMSFEDERSGLPVTLDVTREPAGECFDFRVQKDVPVGIEVLDAIVNTLDGYSPDGAKVYGPAAVNRNNSHEVYAFHRNGANVVLAASRS